MASTRLVLIMCLMLGHTSGQQEKCAASVQGVSGIAGVCPSTWIQWGGHCYKATGRALNWTQAKQECVQVGGTMVVPRSDSETQFLFQYMHEETGRDEIKIWINCNDIQEDGESYARIFIKCVRLLIVQSDTEMVDFICPSTIKGIPTKPAILMMHPVKTIMHHAYG